MTQQQNNKRTLKNKHTYQNETLPNRKDFVVSFITGALVGSALGLYFKNKVYQKADDLKVKEQEISKMVKERKVQLEETVEYTKERVEGFLNKSKDEKATLKAQQAAIKEEASANNLSDTSQEAQEIQEAKKEAQEQTKTSAEAKTKEANASTIKAQQVAIKEEASANNLSDTSQEAQEIQEAKKEANKAGEVETQAERLANAAKKKQVKLTQGSKESQLTEALFAEKPVAKNDLKEIPQLVTKKKGEKANTSVKSSTASDNKDAIKQKDAKFENGVITRHADNQIASTSTVNKQPAKKSKTKKTTPSNKRNASKASTNKTSGQKKQNNKKSTQGAKKQNNTSKPAKQSSNNTKASKSPKAKVEPAKSKIEKRTFND
ncbi:hypothetical protein SA19061_13420 [Staphylococcus argenteus]|uniref:hypothetical protein n=1 Tax=Staphylococcus argenteus TaxID=985002 RepID=UPI001FB8EB51|nr:hypothetical protein [Staphylococcus argenteus]GJF44252.1 hypothetical protein SA19061_13420 [Staphylococcus argenteus]